MEYELLKDVQAEELYIKRLGDRFAVYERVQLGTVPHMRHYPSRPRGARFFYELRAAGTVLFRGIEGDPLGMEREAFVSGEQARGSFAVISTPDEPAFFTLVVPADAAANELALMSRAYNQAFRRGEPEFLEVLQLEVR